jgi:hypothetical protein
MVIFSDNGRVGSADIIREGEMNLNVQLRPPGSIHVTCKKFRPMALGIGYSGGVDVSLGAFRFDAHCGDTIDGLPPGRYVLTSKQDAFTYVGLEVEGRSGVKTEAILEVRPPGRVIGRVVEYPGDKPVGGLECDARWASGGQEIGGDPGTISKADGSFALEISQGSVRIWCEGEDHTAGAASLELGASGTATVRVVRYRRNGVDMGAEILAESDGARIERVVGVAARSGLKAGDLVRAVDDIPLAGLSRRSMAALAFFFPGEAKPRWTVVRNDTVLTITAP